MYQVELTIPPVIVQQWLIETMHSGYFYQQIPLTVLWQYNFKEERDAVLFKLRWA